MQLQRVNPHDRSFLIQFYEIMREFGGKIPWLDDMDDMRFATDGTWFCDELQRRLRQDDGAITPYQFVHEDPARTFVGGILHFDRHPERLRDARNHEIVERITANGASYVSCLQVRDVRRGAGEGTRMMHRAINAILNHHGPVWGVVSDAHLIAWYQALGAKILSPFDNGDALWIVLWDTIPPPMLRIR